MDCCAIEVLNFVRIGHTYTSPDGLMANVTVTMGIEFWIVEICCILIAASCGRFCRVCWKKSHGLRGRNFNSVRS